MPIAIAQTESNSDKKLTEVNVFTTYQPHSAEFFKDHLYIADGNSLLIYNTSDLENPRIVNRFSDFNAPGRVLGLSISKERLYIASGPGWIYVLNISDPEKPKIMYQINNLNFANDVAAVGEYMYVADANTGMLVFNLTDPRNPGLVGSFYNLKSNVSGSLQGWGGMAVAVYGKYAFLSGQNERGFYMIDVSNPSKPREVFHFVGKKVYDISASDIGIYLARADGTTQFDILNISNPSIPEIVDGFSILESADRSAIALHPSGNYIYAASGNTWHIFKISDKIAPEMSIEKPLPSPTTTPVQTVTPGKTATITPAETIINENGKTTGKPVNYSIIIVSIFIGSIVLFYWVWKNKIKR